MERKAVLFDLDGTLTDSGEGIMNCVQLALNHFGIPVERRDDLRVFVGPPLRETFPKFGIPEAEVEHAIEVYRSRYNTVGIFENEPYPGVRELLQTLKERGFRLFVATSKPEVSAFRVLDRFELSQYFEEIAGATWDGSRDSKEAVIAYLLEKIGDVDQAVMVGDTRYDVAGASAHGIPTIGVSWGYGTVDDLLAAGAVAIADTAEALLTLLENGC